MSEPQQPRFNTETQRNAKNRRANSPLVYSASLRDLRLFALKIRNVIITG
jgi:hypothetical protein